jgi:hypothetical protein
MLSIMLATAIIYATSYRVALCPLGSSIELVHRVFHFRARALAAAIKTALSISDFSILNFEF